MNAVRRIQFCAGHRLLDHEGKCAHLHGHNYVAFLHAAAHTTIAGAPIAAGPLDAIGRVIDFAVLKARVGGWIEEHWDHGFIYNRADDEARRAIEAVPGQRSYALDANPTAENLADHLLRVVGPATLDGTGVRLVRVVLWETENCYAEVWL